VFVGNGPFLLALDVATGKPAPGFGGEGRLDLKQGVLGDLKDGRYALQSPPPIFGDVVITGSSNGEGSPTAGAYGDVRGWDARTGKLLWTFQGEAVAVGRNAVLDGEIVHRGSDGPSGLC
jgi:quinoprotein glucose dehydrogenase